MVSEIHKKIENQEYLREWKGYDPILIAGVYYDTLDVGENKFSHCIGEFMGGGGEISWWIKNELDNLSDEEKKELENICKYKTYINNKINHELVKKIADLFECQPFHIWRTRNKNIFDLCKKLDDFVFQINSGSKGCTSPETINFQQKYQHQFKILSFEEYKKEHD
jgi:hypothetical protein